MFEYPAPWIIAGLAALLGFGMGFAALVTPRWAQSVVRLAPDPRWKGGWAEFRASFGGALCLLFGAALGFGELWLGLFLACIGVGLSKGGGAGFFLGLFPRLYLSLCQGRAVSVGICLGGRGTRGRGRAVP